MVLSIPASVPVDGSRTLRFIPTAVNPAAIKLSEITAGTDIGCYITGDGWQPSGDEQTITDARLCAPQDFEQPGRESNSLAIRYVYNLAVVGDDVARITLPKGTTGILVLRLQKDSEQPWAVGDKYEAWPIKAGVQRVMPGESNAVDRIDQKAFVTGQVQRFKTIVTG